MQNDRNIAELISSVALQYHKDIGDETISKNKTRMEVIRKLDLIAQSIKGLMKGDQVEL